MRKRISVDYYMLFQIALLIMAFGQIYSYINSPWEIVRSEWSLLVTASQAPVANTIVMVCKNCSFILILALALLNNKLPKKAVVYLVLFFPICIFHAFLFISESGFTQSLYVSNISWMYLLLIGFTLGYDKKLWEKLNSTVAFLLVCYLVAFFLNFFTSFRLYGWLVYQNSSLMTFYSQIVWLGVITMYRHIETDAASIKDYVLCGLLVVGAIIIRSRSWLIVSLVILISTVISILKQQGKATARIIKLVIGIAVIGIVLYISLNRYLGDFVMSLINKGTTDTRSFQYIEIFEQTEWYQWIFGKGTSATYVSKLYGNYNYIDNEFIYLSFHYGVIFAVMYFYPYIKSVVNCIKCKSILKTAAVAGVYIALWVMSVNGLSVFNRILMDAKSFMMPFFAGYIYHKCLDCEREEIYENDVYR